MHYLGLVIVPEPTDEAIDKAMEPFGLNEHLDPETGDYDCNHDSKWDWYVVGGRWDGWFGGEEEMKKRETNNGFNFDASNRDISRNYLKLSELTPEMIEKGPYFIVCDGVWDERENWISSEN